MYAEVQLQIQTDSERVQPEVQLQIQTDSERVYAEVQLQVHTGSESVKTEVQVHTDSEKVYAEVQLQVHTDSEMVYAEVQQVHTDTERVYAEVQQQVHTDSERVYVCLAITCHLHFWHNDKMRYCGDTGEDRVLMCSNAFRSVWLHHTHEGDVRLYCFIQQMCEAITHASTPLFQWLFDSVWVSRLVDSFLVPIWFVNKVTETNF